jgi:hypothetical protein
MKLYEAHDLLEDAQQLHSRGDLNEAEKRYHALFNREMDNSGLMYLIGTLHMQRGNHGLAALLLSESLKRNKFAEAWNNLGICFKKEFFKEKAATCFQEASKLKPQDADFPSNESGCYINEGMPEKAIELTDRALSINPDHVQSKWHKSLALLELQRWKEGFELYESRLLPEAGNNTAIRNYADKGMTPWWDGKSKGLVAIHGEQGIGDEILFATCMDEAIQTGAEIVFECTPRMEDLFRRSLACRVVGTHRTDGSEWREGRHVDYKCGVGSLGKFYRSDGKFPGTPYLLPNAGLKRSYAKRLKSLGPKPKIGIAWQGGVPVTRIDLRTIRLNEMLPILKQDADFISLQYTKAAKGEVEMFKEEHGIRIIHWKEAAEAQNMDEYASMMSNLDMVISVCQTAIHVAGGLGVPCLCLTPYAPAWRYGMVGNMDWYGSVDLIRQVKGDDWSKAIAEAADRLSGFLASRYAA